MLNTSTKTSKEAEPQAPQKMRSPQGPANLLVRIAHIADLHQTTAERGRAFLELAHSCLGSAVSLLDFESAGTEHSLESAGGPEGRKAWEPTLREAMLTARTQGRAIAKFYPGALGQPNLVLIAAPLLPNEHEATGAISVLSVCDDEAEATFLKLHLQSAAAFVSKTLTKQERSKAPSANIDNFARVLSRAAQYRTSKEFLYAIANSAKQRFNCEQVSVGLLRNNKVRVECISGLSYIKPRTPGVHVIEQAMGECADAGHPIIEQTKSQWQDGEETPRGILHRRWKAASAGAAVASVPIYASDKIIGIFSMRRSPDEWFDTDDMKLVEQLLAPLGAALPLVDRSTRSLPKHTVDAVKKSVSWAVRPQSVIKKLVAAGVITAATWFAFQPSMYQVATQATVVADREHIIAAPHTSAITHVLVRAGDRVHAGQQLAKLDTSLLELQAAAADSEILRAQVRRNEAMAQGDVGGATAAEAERAVYVARKAELQQQIEQSQIVAPWAGIVAGTTLSNLQGRIVAGGEQLMTVSDESAYTIEMMVPESRVTDITDGATIRFASNARPEAPTHSTLSSISQSGKEHQGRMVFTAKSPVCTDQGWLRPGMEGVAIIDAGERPNWWIATHRVIDAARLNFWIR